jgi:hypothetical protein
MLNQDQVQALRSPFPDEALSEDVSRGFPLTSIAAAYVLERLGDVFGPCGIGWRYAHTPFDEVETGNGRVEVVTEVALQYRFKPTNDCVGCDPVMWNAQAGDWTFRAGASNHDWSEPIFACGGHAVGKGGVPLTDARKSAVTDGLTKAASMIGVGHEVFKGLVRVGGSSGQTTKKPEQVQSKGNGRQPVPTGRGQDNAEPVATEGNGKANATEFWKLFNAQGKAAGVSMEAAKELAGKGNWAIACTELQTLIATGAVD